MKSKRVPGPRQRNFAEFEILREPGTLTVTFPLHTVSPKSMHEMPWSKNARVKNERRVTGMYLLTCRPLPKLPVKIVLIRLAPKELDWSDNLNTSLAAVRDEIAQAYDVNDRGAPGDPIIWDYHQIKQSEYGVKIEISPAENP